MVKGDGMVSLEFDSMPSLMAAYARVLKPTSKTFDAAQSVPRFEARVKNLRVEPKNLALFGRVCGVPIVSHNGLPPTYPHVMAGALHAQIVTHPDFPIPALGLVHVRNVIRQYETMPQNGEWEVVVSAEGHRDVKVGVEFDILTDFKVDGRSVWEQTTTAIHKIDGPPKEKKSRSQEPLHSGLFRAMKRSATWHVSEAAGRQYASVSGDYNPIHLHALAARPFGFKRAIATGMWSLARAAAELDDDFPQPPFSLEVAFKRPIFLPSRVIFSSWTKNDAQHFVVESLDGQTLHLEGLTRPL